MAKIAVVGDRDSALLFKAVGLDVYFEERRESAGGLLRRLAREGYAVLFVTEELYEACGETIAEYAAEAYPAIIPIPSSRGSRGVGMRALKANVEKAVGVDILFNN